MIELLQHKTINSRAFETLRTMKPARQVEVAEIMVTGDHVASGPAAAIVVSS